MSQEIPGRNVRPDRHIDWAGLSVFVLSLAVGVTVVVVAIAELMWDEQPDSGILASAITAVLGAMVGAVSTYAGLGRRSLRELNRQQQQREDP
jgi:hypothetical protein